ncbi:S8 family serine peptidase [Lysobacter sp. A3-1-A15]|uniref:S8 family serine peptidase n=1 Tax=Novilysobacter viscosus TaxID=3098602 RepID=UPI002ED78C08
MKHKAIVLALGAAIVMVTGAAMAAQPDANRVIVKFKAGKAASVEAAVRGAGGNIHRRLDKQRAIAVTLPPQALQGLRNRADVEYIEPDAPRYPSGQVTPYGINSVQAPETWAVGADGTGIKVCVIDSGINANHEDFAGVSMSGYASAGQNWNTDSCGHGTHVAGSIAAVNNNSGVVGVSPGKVSLHIVKVFDGASCGWSYASTLVDAANRCEAAGAKVINMSLGGGGASTTERNAFDSLNSQGVLSIAAAGNDGNSTLSYPASYDSVVSVAAIDSNNAVASFSQYNNQVEIAAPGVGVLSTYPSRDAAMSVGGASFIVSALEGSVQSTASGAMASGGRCTSAGSWAGKVVLCERGDISFADKVANVTAGGGVAAVVYNNVPGGFSGTLGGASSIPGISMSQEDGQALVAGSLGQSANVSTIAETNTSGYAYLDGTSMASPHVAGAAAIIWSADPSATNQQVRDAMNATALDLGTAGRDNYYGNGLVQTFDATEALLGGGGGTDPGPGPDPVGAPAGLTAYNYGKSKGTTQVGLAWSGGAVTVDVLRDGSKIASAISNAGSYTDGLKGRGTATYRVCNAGTSECSATASVNY